MDHSLLKSYNGGLWKTITALGPKDPQVAYTVSITVVRMENTTVHRRQITDRARIEEFEKEP